MDWNWIIAAMLKYMTQASRGAGIYIDIDMEPAGWPAGAAELVHRTYLL